MDHHEESVPLGERPGRAGRPPGRRRAGRLLCCLLTLAAGAVALPPGVSHAVGGAGARVPAAASSSAAGTRPNIIYVLADDLGYGDLGSYGQRRIATPHLDAMAAGGVRFTRHYASAVCAPARTMLLTGQQPGHSIVRGLVPHVDLPAGTTTVPRVLRGAGYATGIIGKWGLGDPDTTGVPQKQGFDDFYGYLTHAEAHDYYPSYLWRGSRQEKLPAGTYAPQRFTSEAKEFVTRHAGRPFFLYLAYPNPHAGEDGRIVPSLGRYADEPWPLEEKRKAASITWLDQAVGELLAHLKATGQDQKTIVMFSSDNGPHAEGGVDPAFFRSSAGLRGHKRSLYEGGIRVPLLVRAPGRVRAGRVVDELYGNWDLMRTATQLAGVAAPPTTDGMSMVAALTGTPPRSRPDLYFEYHGEDAARTRAQAVIEGDWKAVRTSATAPVQLFDLRTDPQERRNVAASRPALVRHLTELMARRRLSTKRWP